VEIATPFPRRPPRRQLGVQEKQSRPQPHR
jgi:hypothetical protein